jgi:hypothetical protein
MLLLQGFGILCFFCASSSLGLNFDSHLQMGDECHLSAFVAMETKVFSTLARGWLPKPLKEQVLIEVVLSSPVFPNDCFVNNVWSNAFCSLSRVAIE